MIEHNELNLALPIRELAVLKENQFKKVSLMEDDASNKFIAKTFRGHEDQHSRWNAEYAFKTLYFFYQHFKDHLVTPMPLGIDLDLHTVYLEYLPQLPSAKLLTSQSLIYAGPFFEQCYRTIDDHGFIRPISQSIYFNDEMEAWINDSKPLSLGLKGDLWQNLCLSNGKLLLADIDSAALEPLGLSELVMHAEIHAELSFKNLWHKLLRVRSKPVCFNHLSRADAELLLDIALEFVAARMGHLSVHVRKVKIRNAQTAISSSINTKSE